MSDRILLLVEDDRGDEELAIRALRRSGIRNEVIVARDGAEALALLHGGEEPGAAPPGPLPAVVLLDFKLPKIAGLDVLRRLRARERTRLLPVVILTSSREERDRLAVYAAGANSFVRKPIEAAEFCEAIRMLGHYWLVLNEAPPAASP